MSNTQKSSRYVAISEISAAMKFLHNIETAFHEAGHTIVGLAMGLWITELWVDGKEGLADLTNFVWMTGVQHSRRAITINAAGYEAEELYHEEQVHGKYLSPKRRQAEYEFLVDLNSIPADSPKIDTSTRVSNLIQYWDRIDGNTDPIKALVKADAICRARQTTNRQVTLLKSSSTTDIPLTDAILSEIRRAERRAERILKQYWDAVTKLARSLATRRSGRMTGNEVKHLLRSTSAAALFHF